MQVLKDNKVHISFWLVFILILLVELAYRDALFDYSIDAIKELQEDRNKGFTMFLQILSYIGDGPLYYFAIFVAWLCCSMSRQFYYLFVSAFGLSIMCMGKLIYGEARPYFVDSEIDPLGECTAGYGNPSGHTIYIFLWSVMLYLDVLDGFSKKPLPIAFFALVVVPFCALNGFSRLYVGVHSLNQIVFGACLGLYCAFYSHYIVRKPLMKHVEELLKAQKD